MVTSYHSMLNTLYHAMPYWRESQELQAFKYLLSDMVKSFRYTQVSSIVVDFVVFNFWLTIYIPPAYWLLLELR